MKNKKTEPYTSWHPVHKECHSSFRLFTSEKARDYLASVMKKDKEVFEVRKSSFYDKGRQRIQYTLFIQWK